MAKPKITRIKAGDSSSKSEEEQAPITRKKVVVEDKKQEKTKAKEARKRAKAEKKAAKAKENGGKKVFILFRPFVAFGRYLRDSWREIRQVRWPTRKATWKMVLAVLVYTALFVIFITLLDMFFSWLFSLIIK
jgi:preprotein translocase SecE subunit